ncbi:MAG: hypothetical protein OEM82_14840 [Acidobacteriota bacterium]|nr:hypothetical protein [Acidobacteriota bacterium]
MLEKIYFSIWALFALVVAMFYFAGWFDYATVTVLGFIMFGLIFMGMIGVLPFWTTHHAGPRH